MDCILPEYRLSKEKYEELWNNCIFALDTNVLFNIYRYSPTLRGEVIALLSKISPKLWISHQVALEFYDNNSSVISEEIDKYNEIIKIISAFSTNRGEVKTDLRRKHTTTSEILKKLEEGLAILEKEVYEKMSKIKDEVTEQIEKYPQKKDFEEINNTILSLFDGKVGKPYSIEELEQICEKGLKRYKLLIPPGYEDRKKSGIKKFGDLIAWFQIIDMAKEKDTPVILICDDLKEDWWWKPSGTTLGPRPELVKEFISETKQLFWIYSLDRFLEYAKIYIKSDIKDDAISEAKDFRSDEEERQKGIMALEKFLLPSFKPEIFEAMGRACVNPEIAEAIERATLKPEIFEAIERATLKPEIFEAMGRATLKPEIFEAMGRATLKPEIFEAMGRACVIPGVIEAFTKLQLPLNGYQTGLENTQSNRNVTGITSPRKKLKKEKDEHLNKEKNKLDLK